MLFISTNPPYPSSVCKKFRQTIGRDSVQCSSRRPSIYRIRETYENIPSIGARQAPRDHPLGYPAKLHGIQRASIICSPVGKRNPCQFESRESYISTNNNNNNKTRKLKEKRRRKWDERKRKKEEERGNSISVLKNWTPRKFFRRIILRRNRRIRDINRPKYKSIGPRKKETRFTSRFGTLYGPSLVLQSVDPLSRN